MIQQKILDIVTNVAKVVTKKSCKELEQKADEIIKDIRKL